MGKNEEQTQLKAYQEAGKKLKEQGKLEEAIKQYSLALELNPNHISSLHQLGGIYEETKKRSNIIKKSSNFSQITVKHKQNWEE